MKITITEALAEIKLIAKKIESKRKFVVDNLTRAKHLPDPLGDSAAAMNSEMQSISDLMQRHMKIRSSIATANLANAITIGDVTHSIFDWLTYKREIATKYQQHLQLIGQGLKQQIDRAMTNPGAYKDAEGNPHILEIAPNLSYPDMQKTLQNNQEVLDKLDGQLSLKNATIIIDI